MTIERDPLSLDALGDHAVAAQPAVAPAFDDIRRRAQRRAVNRRVGVGALFLIPLAVVGLFLSQRADNSASRITVTSPSIAEAAQSEESQSAESQSKAPQPVVPLPGEPLSEEPVPATGPGVCGDTLPFDALAWPVSSLSGEVTSRTEGPSLVVTHRVGDASIEMRWPALAHDHNSWTEPPMVPSATTYDNRTFTVELSGTAPAGSPPGPLLMITQPTTDLIAPACELVEITMFVGTTLGARFGWDLTVDEDREDPFVELRPLVTRTELSGFDIPEGMLDCGTTFPSDAFDEPRAALAWFSQASPGFQRSGYHEFVLNTEVHVYGGARLPAGDPGDYVSFVTVSPTAEGWQVTTASNSPC